MVLGETIRFRVGIGEDPSTVPSSNQRDAHYRTDAGEPQFAGPVPLVGGRIGNEQAGLCAADHASNPPGQALPGQVTGGMGRE